MTVVTVKCEICGKEFLAGRIDCKYCSGKCRATSYRNRSLAKKKEREAALLEEGKVMLAKLQAIAPKTASNVQRLIKKHGVECMHDAIKLALTAHHEATSVRQ